MNATKILQGASRLPLTPKRGNKDFYKGTGQAYVPGGGHRTGPPGKHVIAGKAKYRILDEKVRYFVGPGLDAMEATNLRPYVSSTVPHPPKPSPSTRLPSFSPNILSSPLYTHHPQNPSQPLKIRAHDTKAYSKWYRSFSHEERTRVVAEARRGWYAAWAGKGVEGEGGEGEVALNVGEKRTREVESIVP